jgi:BirA family biotin operon repressor/biotin-[acetyl-CoA-carboxylase] ligase
LFKINQTSPTLFTKKMIPPLVELEIIDSTNNYAMGLIHAGVAQDGTGGLAYQQTDGKGQRGNNWVSPKGESLSLSVLAKPVFLPTTQGFQLLATVAVAVRQVLEDWTKEEIKIKWPNDLYWRDRKAGGILIESLLAGTSWNWAVIGIGLNVQQAAFSASLPNPVSLYQITGKKIDVKELALTLREHVLDQIEFLKKNGFKSVFETYNQVLYKRNEPVTLKQGNRRFETIIQGVSEDGRLIAGEHGSFTFHFGEVEWVVEF